MDKEIEKAINLTQRLRAVMLQAVSLEKEIEEWEASDEYLQSIVGDMKEAVLALTTRPGTLQEDATDILASIDQLLYALMDLGGDEAWKDEGEFEQRTQLKLGEALKDRMILATALAPLPCIQPHRRRSSRFKSAAVGLNQDQFSYSPNI